MRTPDVVQLLKSQLGAGGVMVVTFSLQGTVRATVAAQKFTETLRKLLAEPSTQRRERLVVEKLDFIGLLDLHDFGSEAEPIFTVELKECRFFGGIDVGNAYFRGLNLKECTLAAEADARAIFGPDILESRPMLTAAQARIAREGSFAAIGTTVLNRVEFRAMHVTSSSVVDWSYSSLKRGVLISDLGQPPSAAVPAESGVELGCAAGSSLRFTGATVLGSIQLEGVNLVAERRPAISARELVLQGSLQFRISPTKRPCVLHGEVCLRGAEIKGEVLFESVTLSASEQTPQPANSRRPTYAIAAHHARVGADFRLIASEADPSSGACKVTGQINLQGIQVRGSLIFHGSFDSDGRQRAIRSDLATVGGSVWFGGVQNEPSSGCTVLGEADLTGSRIRGNLHFSHSVHSLAVQLAVAPMVSRRQQRYAVNLNNVTIENNLWCQGSEIRPCSIEAMGLLGATINGWFWIRGVTIRAKDAEKYEWRHALHADGATLRLGIEIRLDNEKTQVSKIDGGFLLRNATVGGPMVLRGTKLNAGKEGIALQADNTRFSSDVKFVSEGANRTEVEGELRFLGVSIAATLWVQGTRIVARTETATALDCYTAEIQKAIWIGELPSEGGVAAVPSEIEGIVGLTHTRATDLTLGAAPKAIEPGTKPALSMTGALLLRDLRLQGMMVLSDAFIRPADKLEVPLAQKARDRLRELSVVRPHTIIDAPYATFGTRLFVRFRKGSHGIVNLYAASTGTIGALRGSELKGTATSPDALPEDWGPLMPAVKSELRGKPVEEEKGSEYILVNLDEFTFRRLTDGTEKEDPAPADKDRLKSSCYWLLGRPKRIQLVPRYNLLQQQVQIMGSTEPVVISPHRQLSKVYGEMGNLKLSYAWTRERKWLEIDSGKLNAGQRWIDVLFSALFGSGYSSQRTLITLVLLWLCSAAFVSSAHLSGHFEENALPGASQSASTLAVSSRTATTEQKAGDDKKRASPSATSTALPERAAAKDAAETTQVEQKADDHTQQASASASSPATPETTVSKSSCEFGRHNRYAYVAESLKVILPFTRNERDTGCALDPKKTGLGSVFLLSWRAVLQTLSWVIFPLAIITLTGVLREKT